MGLLSDIYSFKDGLKRQSTDYVNDMKGRLSGLLSDPAGTIQRGVKQFGQEGTGYSIRCK